MSELDNIHSTHFLKHGPQQELSQLSVLVSNYFSLAWFHYIKVVKKQQQIYTVEQHYYTVTYICEPGTADYLGASQAP